MADVPGLLRSFKSRFLSGLFVLVPVALTLFTVGWVVHAVDGALGSVLDTILGRHVPGLGLAATVLLCVAVGTLMSNYLVQQFFEWVEEGLLRVPVVRAVYKTVKAVTDMFSPENEKAFRQVVLVEYPRPGQLSLGFVTGRFDLVGSGPGGRRVAVYVPTNHFYLGNTVFVPEAEVLLTDLSVQAGVQVVLSSGAGLPARVSCRRAADGGPDRERA
jgi:uncharacterized membrane protein